MLHPTPNQVQSLKDSAVEVRAAAVYALVGAMASAATEVLAFAVPCRPLPSIALPWPGSIEVASGIDAQQVRPDTPLAQTDGARKPASGKESERALAALQECVKEAVLERGYELRSGEGGRTAVERAHSCMPLSRHVCHASDSAAVLLRQYQFCFSRTSASSVQSSPVHTWSSDFVPYAT